MKTDKQSRVEMQDIGGIQPEPLFNYLLTTPPSASNCIAIMAHVMVSWSSGASFTTMSEGVQV